MVSSVLRPDEYSASDGDRAIALTNHGSLLMSPVYKTALPCPSNTLGWGVSVSRLSSQFGVSESHGT